MTIDLCATFAQASEARRSTLYSMTIQTISRPGRNEPCHCGSGRKYKHCCLSKDESEAGSARAKVALEDAAPSTQPPAATQTRTRKTQTTDQPWKAKTARGFVPRARGPRKVGGS